MAHWGIFLRDRIFFLIRYCLNLSGWLRISINQLYVSLYFNLRKVKFIFISFISFTQTHPVFNHFIPRNCSSSVGEISFTGFIHLRALLYHVNFGFLLFQRKWMGPYFLFGHIQSQILFADKNYNTFSFTSHISSDFYLFEEPDPHLKLNSIFL